MTDNLEQLRAKLGEARKSHTYRREAAVLDFTEDLLARMEALGLSKADLARKLGTSAPYVTKILRGNANFTLDSLIKIADAVDCDLSTHLAPREHETMWIEVLKEERSPAATTSRDSFESLCITEESRHELASAA